MRKGIFAIFILSVLMVSVSGCYAIVQQSDELIDAFLVVSDVSEARDSLEFERHIFPEKGVVVGKFTKEELRQSFVERVYYEDSLVPLKFKSEFISWKNMLDYKKIPLEEKLDNIPEVEPIYDDVVYLDEEVYDLEIVPRSLPDGADAKDTSTYMIGDVAVSVIFPESNSGSEDWTDLEIQEVKDEIMAAMDWWAEREPKAHLNFVYNYEERVPTDYEPIEMDGSDGNTFCLWVIDTMNTLGFSGPGCSGPVYEHVNYQRDTLGTDWGFAIFVADSSNDADGRFADGSSAFTTMWAYGGGPTMVMTYDNAAAGIENMDLVCAHEYGHIFGAKDQYGDCECNTTAGYLYYENQNCNNECMIDEDSIMKAPFLAYPLGLVDIYARGQLGLVDSNEDGVLDIVGNSPGVVLNPATEDNDSFFFDGDSWINIYPAENPDYSSFSIDFIEFVEYRYKPQEGSWIDWILANPFDGLFDEQQELYNFVLGDLLVGEYEVASKAGGRFGSENISESQFVTVTSIPPMCDETDNGYDIYNFGIVTDENGSYEDECSGDTLTEYYCGGDGPVEFSEVECLSGCQDGRCILRQGNKDNFEVVLS